MKPVVLHATEGHAALYRAAVDEATNAGPAIIESIIRTTRRALHDHESSVRALHERQVLVEARQYLNKYETVLMERYPAALEAAFVVVNRPARASASVNFDQLELMDELQIMERVELARAEQVVVLAVELSLAAFNPVICAAAGLSTVRGYKNPVRPELYVQALQTVVRQLQLSAAIREVLMRHMSEALGVTLSALYARLAAQLQTQGVQPVGYAVRPAVGGSDDSSAAQPDRRARAEPAQPAYLSPQTIINVQSDPAGYPHATRGARKLRDSTPHDETLLTLDKLRQLLSGDFDKVDAAAAPETFAERFSREFDGARDNDATLTEFDATVPAALEALTEMKQVEHVMERIGSRQARQAAATERLEPTAERLDALRGSSQGLAQALSLEVVALMINNIATDERLLGPVQDVVRSLEPGLLRLALVDPRFFSDKLHPARRLLQEITQRSLAYEAADAAGFPDFLALLQKAVCQLAAVSQETQGAQPFEEVLNDLVLAWNDDGQTGQLESAVQALQHAEERNLLAEQIANEIAARSDAWKIPAGILEFLCGPWAQVMAHARLADATNSDDPGQYRELVLALLWSAQPELTRKNIGKLTRLVPRLLGKLREGLALIDYPSLKTSAFFELLMNLQQQAFKSLGAAAGPAQRDSEQKSLFGAADSWIAPAEARLSGFMEAPAEMAQTLPAVTHSPQMAPSVQGVTPPGAPAQTAVALADVSLSVGSWVELLVNGVWIRTKLSWASSHGTLFLFTGAAGSTQSMTRRSRDKLLLAGTLRIISGQEVVDGALDAVVQTAMNNSIDIKL